MYTEILLYVYSKSYYMYIYSRSYYMYIYKVDLIICI